MTLFVAVLALTGLLVVSPLLGARRIFVATVLASVTIAPIPLIQLIPWNDDYVVGVAQPPVTIYAYTVVILGTVAWAILSGMRSGWLAALLPIGYFVGTAMLFWPQSTLVSAGVVHYVTACLAWIGGLALASEFSAAEPKRFTGWILLLISMLLVVPSWYQWVVGVGADGFGLRAGGLFPHPSTTGKIAIVIIALSLPLTRANSRSVTRLASSAALLAAISAVPSLSRANIIGIALMLAVWFGVQPDVRRLRQLIVVVVIATVAMMPVIGSLTTRFEVDPTGGERPELLAAGWRHLFDSPLTGLGVNYFVPALAPIEPIVADTGFPVHNLFVLLVVEIGLVGVLALSPMLSRVLSAAVPLRRKNCSEDYARALLAMLLALAFVGLSGWGLLRAPMPELILFASGVLCGHVGPIWIARDRSAVPIRGRRQSHV